MKFLNATVTKVLYCLPLGGFPWRVKVEYECCGKKYEREFTFISKEDAEVIKVGYKFQT